MVRTTHNQHVGQPEANALAELIRIHAENRDNNIDLARAMRDRGRDAQVHWYVRRAREWNHELIRLKRES